MASINLSLSSAVNDPFYGDSYDVLYKEVFVFD